MDTYNGFTGYQPGVYYQPVQQYPAYAQRWQQGQVYSQPVQSMPSMQQVNATPQQQVAPSVMTWVQGLEGAKSFILPNGSTLPLWDSESQTIYIKSVDTNGKPSLTILDYTQRDAPGNQTQADTKVEYVTKEQLDGFNRQFSDINARFSELGKYVTKDQLEVLNGQLRDLGNQIEDIQNRMMSFGKPSQGSNNRKGNNNA